MDYSGDQFTPSFEKYPSFSDVNIYGGDTYIAEGPPPPQKKSGRAVEHATGAPREHSKELRAPQINFMAIIVFILVLMVVHMSRELALLRLDLAKLRPIM